MREAFLRKHLTYANAMATLAVFVALGGTGYAVTKVDGGDVKNGSLTGADVRKDSLKGPDIAKKAVKAPEIASNAVRGAEVAPDTLTGEEIAPDALTGVDIAEAQLGTVPNAETVAGTKMDGSPLLRLSEGQESPLHQQGPFTFYGGCRRDDFGVYPVVLVASSEPGQVHAGTAFGFGGDGYFEGDRRALAVRGGTPGRWTTQPFSAVTESGTRVFGFVGVGEEVFGSQCVLSMLSLSGGVLLR